MGAILFLLFLFLFILFYPLIMIIDYKLIRHSKKTIREILNEI